MSRSAGTTTIAPPQLHVGSATGRAVLLATILGSSLAGIDATVVGIALPRIGSDLHASFAGLQWTVTAYTLTLASFILIGGSLGDRFGRRRLFVIGVAGFTVASLGCAAAPGLGLLLAARALQGVGGALLAPASLAIIDGSFVTADRGRAVGWWAGASGVAGAVAPFVGGWLLAIATWRWVFVINLPIAAVVLWLTRRIPETRAGDQGRVDLMGAFVAVAALGSATFAIIESRAAIPAWLEWTAIGVAALAVPGFVAVERRATRPLLPLGLLGTRAVLAVNAVTFVVYSAIGGFFFLVVLVLQVVCGYSPLAAGASVLPVTALTFLLSSGSGALAGRIGPRAQMTFGPVVCALGCLLTTRLSAHAEYLRDVFPAVALFGLGLATMVTPLTTTALAALPAQRAGLASGVNNAVARTGSLLAVATLPVIAGLDGPSYLLANVFQAAYQRCAWICSGLLLAGGPLAWMSIRNEPPATPFAAGEEARDPATTPAVAGSVD